MDAKRGKSNLWYEDPLRRVLRKDFRDKILGKFKWKSSPILGKRG